MQFEPGAARLGQTRQIPLHIGEKHRHALRGKGLGHDLKGDGFSRSRCARNQPVAIGVFQKQLLRRGIIRPAATDKNGLIRHK